MSIFIMLIFLWVPYAVAEDSSTAVENSLDEVLGGQEREKTTVTPEELPNYEFDVTPDPFIVGDLSAGQIQIMNVLRRDAKDLIARKLGILSVRGNKNDLPVFQQLVDRRILRNNQVEEWQSIGILFGDVLADEFHLTWVRYEDWRGVNKALRWRETDNFFFPVTMLSKRVRFREKIDFEDLFAELALEVEGFKAYESRPKMPERSQSQESFDE